MRKPKFKFKVERLVSYTQVFNQDIQINQYSFLSMVKDPLLVVIIGLQLRE